MIQQVIARKIPLSKKNINLSKHWQDTKFIPKRLLKNSSSWRPYKSSIDEKKLIQAHPELNDPNELVSSGVLEKILNGEMSLYLDLPPINISAYLEGLRRKSQEEISKHDLSALEHLASMGWQRFHNNKPLGKDIDRFQKREEELSNFISKYSGRMRHLLVVICDEINYDYSFPAKEDRLTDILYAKISEMAKIWLKIDSDPNLLVSFCHASDKIKNSAYQLIQDYFYENKKIIFTTSDEEIQWSALPEQPPGNRQYRTAVTPWRLITRGAIGGLITFRATALNELNLPRKSTTLYCLMVNLAFQICSKRLAVGHISEPLLIRDMEHNPSILDVTSPSDWVIIKKKDIKLDNSTQRVIYSSTLLAEGASLHPCQNMHGCNEIRWKIPANTLVSIMIPFRDKINLNKLCLNSIEKHAGKIPYEIVMINNGSKENETIEWIQSLEETTDIKIIDLDCEFNYAKINNIGRKFCSGTHILFLNNDVEFKADNVLQKLLDPFAMHRIGAVGARLLYPEGSIQHQGVALVKGERRCLLEPGKHLKNKAIINNLTPLRVQEEFSAASAACLMIKAKDFDEIGGFDEKFAVVFNDVDLCLRLHKKNKSIVVTPYVDLVHHESISRGKDQYGLAFARHQRESGYLRHKHKDLFQTGDPFYSDKLNPHSNRYQPRDENSHSLRLVPEEIIYQWKKSQWESSEKKRIILFAHYDKDGKVRKDIMYLLKSYQEYADIIFISSSPQLRWRKRTLKELRNYCSTILIRKNIGYDFGSWMCGFKWIEKEIKKFYEIVITNDSVYGPVRPLSSLFEKIKSAEASVIGLTDDLMYYPHLQSYFLVFKKDVLENYTFREFWNQLKIWPKKRDLVKNCEVGLSTLLQSEGFQLESIYTKNSNGNILHTDWKELIVKQGFPFLKVSLLRDNPSRQNIDGWYNIIKESDVWLANELKSRHTL